MKQPLIIWGASGQARVLYEFLEPAGYDVVAVFDNSTTATAPFADVPLYVGETGFETWRESYAGTWPVGVVAIGSPGQIRMEVQNLLERHKIDLLTCVHPRAFVARTARLGKGCQILAQAAVAADASLGDQCIVNTAASVDHESRLGDGVHLGPGARVLGCVTIGNFAFVGGGAVILSRLKVGTNSIVGAGSVVTRDVPDNVVAYGNPASVRKTVSGAARPR